MTKVSLSADQVISLIKSAKRAGTQRADAAIDLAIEWITVANAEIIRLKSEMPEDLTDDDMEPNPY